MTVNPVRLAALALVALTTPAAALSSSGFKTLSTTALMRACTTPEDAVICQAYFQGFLERDRVSPSICLPAGMDVDEVIVAYVDYVEGHPALRPLQANLSVTAYFSRHLCKR